MELKFRTLKPNEIEVRISQIASNWATLLLYKNARVDMDILDETVGCLNWKREHKRENANCVVSIWDEEKKEWVAKEDTGTESYTEKEKGLASDSFKRACVNIGIGRELYTSPSIFITPRKDMVKKGREGEFYENTKGKYETKTRFNVELIDYDDNRNITNLIIRDDKGNVRFSLLDKDHAKKIHEAFDKLHELIEKVDEKDDKFEREKIWESYGVSMDIQLTYEQILEAIEVLKKKLKKGE